MPSQQRKNLLSFLYLKFVVIEVSHSYNHMQLDMKNSMNSLLKTDTKKKQIQFVLDHTISYCKGYFKLVEKVVNNN